MKSEIKINTVKDVKGVINILEDMIKSMSQGLVCIEKDEEYISLKPQGEIKLEIEASQKKNKQKFNIEMSWTTGKEKDAADEDVFTISSNEPEIKEEISELKEAVAEWKTGQ